MTTQIEQLIEKYKKNYKEMRLEIPIGEIIQDLQSLQPTTEERVETKKILKDDGWAYYNNMWKD